MASDKSSSLLLLSFRNRKDFHLCFVCWFFFWVSIKLSKWKSKMVCVNVNSNACLLLEHLKVNVWSAFTGCDVIHGVCSGLFSSTHSISLALPAFLSRTHSLIRLLTKQIYMLYCGLFTFAYPACDFFTCFFQSKHSIIFDGLGFSAVSIVKKYEKMNASIKSKNFELK